MTTGEASLPRINDEDQNIPALWAAVSKLEQKFEVSFELLNCNLQQVITHIGAATPNQWRDTPPLPREREVTRTLPPVNRGPRLLQWPIKLNVELEELETGDATAPPPQPTSPNLDFEEDFNPWLNRGTMYEQRNTHFNGDWNSDFRFKLDFPIFDGHLDIKDYLDWEHKVDNFFEYMTVPKERKLSLWPLSWPKGLSLSGLPLARTRKEMDGHRFTCGFSWNNWCGNGSCWMTLSRPYFDSTNAVRNKGEVLENTPKSIIDWMLATISQSQMTSKSLGTSEGWGRASRTNLRWGLFGTLLKQSLWPTKSKLNTPAVKIKLSRIAVLGCTGWCERVHVNPRNVPWQHLTGSSPWKLKNTHPDTAPFRSG